MYDTSQLVVNKHTSCNNDKIPLGAHFNPLLSFTYARTLQKSEIQAVLLQIKKKFIISKFKEISW